VLLAGITLSIYFGASQARPSDLSVTQPALANNAVMHDVRWQNYPFRAPIYYGVRFTYTPPNHPWTQIAIDFTHLKVYANTHDVVRQTGTWHGSSFAERVPLNQRVQSFEITHGVNLLGLTVLRSTSPRASPGAYVGAGPVIYLPHSENRVDGQPGGDGYEYGGGGFQVLAGVRGCFGAKPVFAELKYSHGTPRVTIAHGRARTRVDAIHELAGITLSGCAR
jgi:hypothetical protein